MRERFPTVYKRSSLGHFSFTNRIVIRIADLAFYLLIRGIGSTLRYEADGEESFAALEASGKPWIFALWHDRIFASVYYFRGRNIAILTSQSKDGEYIARFLTRLGLGAVRGSSSRGGVRGLVEMIKLMREGVPMAFTVDGPRGPRYEAKSGPVMLAKKAGGPIVPLVVECKKYWTIRSWDRLQIPRPFTRVRVFYGDAIVVAADASEEAIGDAVVRLQNSLDELVERGRRWREDSRD